MTAGELFIGILVAIGMFLITIKVFPYRLEGENRNKIRPLGFVCDRCKGKYDKNGNRKIRCRVKQCVLTRLGVDVHQTEIPRQEAEWWLG